MREFIPPLRFPSISPHPAACSSPLFRVLAPSRPRADGRPVRQAEGLQGPRGVCRVARAAPVRRASSFYLPGNPLSLPATAEQLVHPLALLPRAPFSSAIIILVKAGSPVDDTIAGLLKYLEPGDIIVVSARAAAPRDDVFSPTPSRHIWQRPHPPGPGARSTGLPSSLALLASLPLWSPPPPAPVPVPLEHTSSPISPVLSALVTIQFTPPPPTTHAAVLCP